MNKRYYSFGNPFKVKFREHNCFKCGTKLSIVTNRKVVSPRSEEAKYYDFNIDVDGGIMVGPCEFIHNVFYCPKCKENIEFVTQINQEDIDRLVKEVNSSPFNKGRKIAVRKGFENQDGVIEDRITNIDQIHNLCLSIEEDGKTAMVYKIPISRKKYWERPCYFKVTKKQLNDFFK